MAQRFTIEADILPAEPTRLDRMARTRTGIVIGIAHQRTQRPAASADMERLQAALISRRQGLDWDGIAIAAFMVAAALSFVFAR